MIIELLFRLVSFFAVATESESLSIMNCFVCGYTTDKKEDFIVHLLKYGHGKKIYHVIIKMYYKFLV
jgi:hypothetical protein